MNLSRYLRSRPKCGGDLAGCRLHRPLAREPMTAAASSMSRLAHTPPLSASVLLVEVATVPKGGPGSSGRTALEKKGLS